MAGAGTALMGIGSSRGEGRAVTAAQKAINSPLLEASMDGAHGVLLSIAGGSDLGLFEINEAASLVQEAAHEDANIIFGTVIDDSLGDEVRVTVIAAGFDSTPSTLPPLTRGAEGRGQGQARPNQAQADRPEVDQFEQAPQGQGTEQHGVRYDPPVPVGASASNGHPNGHGQGYQQRPEPQRQASAPRPMPFEDDDVDVPPFMRR